MPKTANISKLFFLTRGICTTINFFFWTICFLKQIWTHAMMQWFHYKIAVSVYLHRGFLIETRKRQSRISRDLFSVYVHTKFCNFFCDFLSVRFFGRISPELLSVLIHTVFFFFFCLYFSCKWFFYSRHRRTTNHYGSFIFIHKATLR